MAYGMINGIESPQTVRRSETKMKIGNSSPTPSSPSLHFSDAWTPAACGFRLRWIRMEQSCPWKFHSPPGDRAHTPDPVGPCGPHRCWGIYRKRGENGRTVGSGSGKREDDTPRVWTLVKQWEAGWFLEKVHLAQTLKSGCQSTDWDGERRFQAEVMHVIS